MRNLSRHYTKNVKKISFPWGRNQRKQNLLSREEEGGMTREEEIDALRPSHDSCTRHLYVKLLLVKRPLYVYVQRGVHAKEEKVCNHAKYLCCSKVWRDSRGPPTWSLPPCCCCCRTICCSRSFCSCLIFFGSHSSCKGIIVKGW